MHSYNFFSISGSRSEAVFIFISRLTVAHDETLFIISPDKYQGEKTHEEEKHLHCLNGGEKTTIKPMLERTVHSMIVIIRN